MGLTMLSRFIAFGLMISIPVFAADDCDPQVIDQNVIGDLSQVSSRLNVECPNQLDVPSFCSSVAAQTLENNPSHPTILYQYQTQIFAASCIQNSDSSDLIKAKVQNFWNKYHDKLTCNQVNFTPRNGNILKLAIARQAGPFLDDALDSWKVNLNHVDPVDNFTVLDYIELKKTQAGSNSSFSRVLQRYYDRFKSAGAKHRREL